MNCAYWLRVSTDEQDTANQRPALDAMRTQRGDPEPVVVFDLAASAAQGHHRGEWRKLVHLARQGRVQRVYVWSLDRVSREGIGPVLAAVHGLLSAGCELVSYREPWLEVENDERDLLIAITGWTAWMEARRLSERTKAGLVKAQAKHGMVGKRGPDKRPRKSRTARAA